MDDVNSTFRQTPPGAMDQQYGPYLCKRCNADLQRAAAAMHIHDLSAEVGWLASRSTGLACINTSAHLTKSRDRKMNAPKNSRKELSLVAETLEVSISNQDFCSQVVGPTVCASTSSLFVHVHRPFESFPSLGTIFSCPAVGLILKERRRIGRARPQYSFYNNVSYC